ncbi:hypothetical protein ATY79_21785 [Rhizobium sp. R693]|nr:hypothetical protein ATY79_21785 [Rhizobium sp. R693]
MRPRALRLSLPTQGRYRVLKVMKIASISILTGLAICPSRAAADGDVTHGETLVALCGSPPRATAREKRLNENCS